MTSSTWIIHCDGAALPRTGRMAIGVHALAPDGAVHTVSRALGSGDNNEAEAHAIVAALALARAHGATHVDVRSDSDVAVAHLTGRKRCSVLHISQPLDEAAALLMSFAEARVVLVTRAKNVEADALARAALARIT